MSPLPIQLEFVRKSFVKVSRIWRYGAIFRWESCLSCLTSFIGYTEIPPQVIPNRKVEYSGPFPAEFAGATVQS